MEVFITNGTAENRNLPSWHCKGWGVPEFLSASVTVYLSQVNFAVTEMMSENNSPPSSSVMIGCIHALVLSRVYMVLTKTENNFTDEWWWKFCLLDADWTENTDDEAMKSKQTHMQPTGFKDHICQALPSCGSDVKAKVESDTHY